MKSVALLSALIGACLAQPVESGKSTTAASNVTLQAAWASYMYPTNPDFARLIGYDTKKIGVLIANVKNGPDSVINSDWKNTIDKAVASGKTVIGYVRTGYLGFGPGFTTRLGSRDLADWTAQIENDVDTWYRLYGNKIGGIFFDEGWNQCGTGGTDNTYADLYEYINDYTKRKYPGAYTILNPGGALPPCYEDTMDTLLTFEQNYGNYTKNYRDTDYNWKPKDPRKIWHIVYDVKPEQIQEVAALARSRGAGVLEITNGVLDNPYNTLPDDSYMQKFLNELAGGVPLNDGPSAYDSGPKASVPGSLKVVGNPDYSSVSLSWAEADNALGYHVYLNGKQVVDLPDSMTRVTIGMIDPGSSKLNFTVRAVGGSGIESADSKPVAASTLALPGGRAINNIKVSVSGTVATYTADVLIPYGFVRIFTWDKIDVDSNDRLPVYFQGNSHWVEANHLVEGVNYYRHAPTAGYSWNFIRSVPVEIKGKSYKWTVDQGSESYDPTKFAIQGEGYAPLTTSFSPCPGKTDGLNFCA